MSDITPIQARLMMTEYLSDDRRSTYEAALKPFALDFDRFRLAVAIEAARQPKIALAIRQAPETLADALQCAAGFGLIPGSAHRQFYLIPRWNSRTNRMEITWITGYRGLATVAYRNPRIQMIDAHVVFKGEPFTYYPGTSEINHEWRADRRTEKIEDVSAGYCLTSLCTPNGMHVDARPLIRVLTIDEILARRERSEAYRAWKKGKVKDTPWVTDPIAMVRKTCIRAGVDGGTVPVDHAMVQLLGAESVEERRVSIEDPASDGGRTGVERLAEKLLDTEPELTPEQARAKLEALKEAGALPDDLIIDMLPDEELIRAAQAYS